MTLSPSRPISTRRAFTVLELLIVIAILGILASIILVSFTSARQRAAAARAQSELAQLIHSAVIAQSLASVPVRQITLNGCSDCVCRNRDLRNVAVTDSCYINWSTALSRLQTATGNLSDLSVLRRDPWGSPFGLDENERESGPADCRRDSLRSAGPDGVLYNADDVGYLIPHSSPCP